MSTQIQQEDHSTKVMRFAQIAAVVISGQPVAGVGELTCVGFHSLIGRSGTVVRQIPGKQEDIRTSPLIANPLDNHLQGVIGIHSQQGTAGRLAQMRIGHLHQPDSAAAMLQSFDGRFRAVIHRSLSQPTEPSHLTLSQTRPVC